ncbi:oligosaccharide flippase family protein [Roseobacter sp. YSTF-M11]|uniref:Oligosaccharide flippase family protein n=1 Tax=Roseobacter insulae TaxID=2859783 RepID=A0A9X1G0E2_9RHOB|nr:oligosaccharide flippase family protein [Roseobacter insulae]
MSGDGVRARFSRGAGLTVLNFGSGNLLRLLSNLILTRLLFPEAFGLMALVQVFTTGLKMFSDTGLKTSIIRSERGDDPDFLNTAWTLQILRGAILWLGTCALAWPAAQIYGAPMLAQLLPVAGLNMLINGFAPTSVATANRNMTLGRVTMINIGTQVLGITLMVVMAWWLQSVWALVIGGLVNTGATVILQHLTLPGIRNRLRFERAAFDELFSFGKFVFLSTAVTFLINQGDKAILGGYISLADMGVYNIGYFLGSVPFLLSRAVNSNVIFPLYRVAPVAEGPKNRAKVFKARRMVSGACLLGAAIMAYSGVYLVDLMYDPRYSLAGPIVVMLSFTLVPQIVITSYGALLLAAGDAKNFFRINLMTAIVQTALMFAGVIWFGIFGVLLAPALALFATHPMRMKYLRRAQGHDGWGDCVLLGTGFLVTGGACWLHWDEVVRLIS